MSRFQGDGRVMLEALPQYVRPGTMPLPLRRASARRMIKNFDRYAFSHHTGRGGLLWVIIEHCETNNISYVIEGERGLGYYVRRK